MTPRRVGRRGVALAFALLVVVLLGALAALALSATMARSRLVGAARIVVDGRAVTTHGLATIRVTSADSLAALPVGDTLRRSAVGPIPGWVYQGTATRTNGLVVLRVIAEFRSGGVLKGRQTATLLLSPRQADTLVVIDRFPRW